jgi:hypothetical protein
MLIKLALAATQLATAGCASFGRQDASVVSASPTSVTMRFAEGQLADATGRAEALCGQHGRAAKMQRVSPTGDDRIANFDCVPAS